MKSMQAYRKGRADERVAVRQKLARMRDQARKFENVQSVEVTLRELDDWLGKRQARVTRSFALRVAQRFEEECIRQGLMRM